MTGLRSRVVTTCGFCLEKWNPDTSIKSPRTSHVIVREFKHEELKQRCQIIKCIRCGTQTEWFPRHKVDKATLRELKLKYEAMHLKTREEAKEARSRRLAKEKAK